ncbi:hypothetical protein BKA70DRAFT_1536441 [Coprinopsis sp. MPI-PUGE-AT-0042]|nr:hypothetical protein BKA70DRAFT_1536441 [Coprinopsis sp. MPI-PUGE-AT-0042]
MAKRDYTVAFTPTFASMAGAQMIATMVTTGLYGVAICMIGHYLFRNSRRDPLWTRALVAALGVTATLEAVFFNYQIYDDFVTKKDDPVARNTIPFSMPAKTVCIFLTAFLAQMFYAVKIWKWGRLIDNHFRFMAVPVVALAILQLGGGLIQVVVMGITKTLTVMKVFPNQRSMYINGSATAACDILITIALVIILRSARANATQRGRSVLEKLVIFTINRGIVTSVFALLSILLYDFASGTLYYLIPFSSNTHIYVISVVSMLIAQEGLGESTVGPHASNTFINTVAPTPEKGRTVESSANSLAESKQDPKDASSRC